MNGEEKGHDHSKLEVRSVSGFFKDYGTRISELRIHKPGEFVHEVST